MELLWKISQPLLLADILSIFFVLYRFVSGGNKLVASRRINLGNIYIRNKHKVLKFEFVGGYSPNQGQHQLLGLFVTPVKINIFLCNTLKIIFIFLAAKYIPVNLQSYLLDLIQYIFNVNHFPKNLTRFKYFKF